jgi:hypothetical protein
LSSVRGAGQNLRNYKLGRFATALERHVHLPKAALGRSQGLPEQANEETAEALTLLHGDRQLESSLSGTA